jgi:hypothetical protein
MLLFRDEEHVKRSAKPGGATMSPDQMWKLADIWYHDRDDPNWRRKTPEEAEQVFASIGLSGDFWRLRT